jgi:Fic family protein
VLKRHQNFIGGSPSNPRFIPPPPDEALKCLDQLEQYLNSNRRPGYELIDAALIHYQFETIHPFPDGNGRVGRILIPVYLKSVGVIDGPYLYMSEYFERNKDEYIDRLYDVSADGAWEPWVRFFLLGIIESCETALKTSASLINCRDFQRDQIASNRGRSAVLTQVMDFFLTSPVLTVTQIAETIGHSDQTVRNNVAWLVGTGLLREARSSRPKLFLSPHVLQIISGGRNQGPQSEDP